jgi:hypothetical protein
LSLRTIEESENELPPYCDQHLSRFSKLTRLELGNDIFSPELDQHIKSLAGTIEWIELGRGPIRVNEWIEFLKEAEGPLHYLRLDNIAYEPGFRIDLEGVCLSSLVVRLPPDDEPIWDDWTHPTEYLLPQPGFGFGDIARLLAEADRAGVEVGGGLEESMATHWLFLVEIANIAILRTYRDQDFRHYKEMSQFAEGQLLPVLDTDQLDPTNLRLVRKVDNVYPVYYLTLEPRDISRDTTEPFAQEVTIKVDFQDGKGFR